MPGAAGDYTYEADVVIAGSGLAGLVTAFELLGRGKKVLLVDKDSRERWGGLARESFGGVHLIGTPHQKRAGIRDTPELAYHDWLQCAGFGPDDDWPRSAQFTTGRNWIFLSSRNRKISSAELSQ